MVMVLKPRKLTGDCRRACAGNNSRSSCVNSARKASLKGIGSLPSLPYAATLEAFSSPVSCAREKLWLPLPPCSKSASAIKLTIDNVAKHQKHGLHQVHL